LEKSVLLRNSEHIAVCCPKCGLNCRSAAGVIIHLNDCHQWSRNDIADMVEALEVNFSVVQEIRKANIE
jgi:uncharacterized C2H2 Zn-finger protein